MGRRAREDFRGGMVSNDWKIPSFSYYLQKTRSETKYYRMVNDLEARETDRRAMGREVEKSQELIKQLQEIQQKYSTQFVSVSPTTYVQIDLKGLQSTQGKFITELERDRDAMRTEISSLQMEVEKVEAGRRQGEAMDAEVCLFYLGVMSVSKCLFRGGTLSRSVMRTWTRQNETRLT